MSDYKVGDPVTVYRHTRGRDDGDPGEIVKVGRTLVHIRTGRITETFRMDTQVQTGPQYGYSTYFRTPEEVALNQRRVTAEGVLHEHGIQFTLGSQRTLEQVESLAEVVKGWEEEEPEDGI